MRIIEFLIFFPFAVALVLFAMGNSERVYEARKNLVKGAGLAIMAAVIYLAVRVLGGRDGEYADHGWRACSDGSGYFLFHPL